jgi:hypothetical protein
MKSSIHLSSLFLLCLCSLTIAAQPQTPPAPARLPDFYDVDQALQTNDNYQIQQALDHAVESLLSPHYGPRVAVRIPDWLHMLIQDKRFTELDDFAIAAINIRPADLKLVETCLQARIRAKLIQHKPKDALPIARSFYNVCSMPDTSRAIDLIAECLYDATPATNPGDPDPSAIVKRFKQEQIRGATTQPANAELASSSTNTLATIPLDPRTYQPGLDHIVLDENAWESLMGQGNLLLLSGRPDEALKVFQKAYTLASDTNLPTATEAVARAMRSQDQTVARANAWILSLRTPDQISP